MMNVASACRRKDSGGLRTLCDKHGALLIFDEVKTARSCAGRASEYFGVTPDMICIAKSIVADSAGASGRASA